MLNVKLVLAMVVFLVPTQGMSRIVGVDLNNESNEGVVLKGSTVTTGGDIGRDIDKSSHVNTVIEINISPDGFAEPTQKIILDKEETDKKKLPESEQKKLGRAESLSLSEGIAYVNGSFNISLNQINSDLQGRYANITVNPLRNPSFKVRAGWKQDFETQYGTFRLFVKSIYSGRIIVETYNID